ncbi:MAG TPA: GAF domain-containing protein [Burkholderiaceae bacterium]|nr:GAF domain-containing protein [Burkholderiaceae bacterium]
MNVPLDSIRGCLEGGVPSLLASCARDGVPNLTYVSQVHYVDREHVALSFQFFNKTYENVRANPQAMAYVADVDTGASYRLRLRYLRTEESGPLFESMKAKLAGIASHTGMSGVFLLRGADVYHVHEVERVPGPEGTPRRPRCNPMSAVRRITERIAAHSDLGTLLDDTLAALEDQLGIRFAKVLLLETGRTRAPRLYTVATRGYSTSGVGSEIAVGEGVIGMAAACRTPIRISHFTAEYTYGRAVREQVKARGLADQLETEIPLPGLPAPASQLAVPIILGGQLAGVLYVESPEDMRFSYDDEDALVAVATQLGMAIAVLQQAADTQNDDAPPAKEPAHQAPGAAAIVRLYRANDSVFIDDDYLIKGVAGSIFAKLVRDYTADGRTEFSNRELRLDPAIRLPDVGDNLEARLILLQRRLVERCDFLRIAKTGRGRFHFDVKRPVKLVEVN